MKIGLLSLLLIVSFFSFRTLDAQTRDVIDTLQIEPQMQSDFIDPLDLEIGEMIFDETITKVGRDFYDLFFNKWSNPTIITDFSITIKERPMPGMGSQIRLFIDEYEILTQFIRPNLEQIELLVEYGVGLTAQYLLNYQEIQAQLQSADQSGTGIF